MRIFKDTKEYTYFNPNGEDVPMQRKHNISGHIETRTLCDVSYDQCEWYLSDEHGKPLNKS